MLNQVIRRLRPGWTRRTIDTLTAQFERFGPAKWITLPEGARLIVIAPHPDDESIGPGGLIAAWTALGRCAEVVFLTDGAAGAPELRAPGMSDSDRQRITRQTVKQRRAEAETALGLLGASACWLDGRDGHLVGDLVRLTPVLAAHLNDFGPDLIAAPFPLDRHVDHAAAARLLARATAQMPQTLPVLAYEVWSPLPATALLDISDVAERKWQAIAAHKSQTRSTDYVAASKALGAYRAISGGGRGQAAEAYHQTTLSGFASLVAAMEV